MVTYRQNVSAHKHRPFTPDDDTWNWLTRVAAQHEHSIQHTAREAMKLGLGAIEERSGRGERPLGVPGIDARRAPRRRAPTKAKAKPPAGPPPTQWKFQRDELRAQRRTRNQEMDTRALGHPGAQQRK
jgi:hypothetical protein